VVKSSYSRTLYAIPILIGACGIWTSVQLIFLLRELLPFDNPGKERAIDELEILKNIFGLVSFAFVILMGWLYWRAAARQNQRRQAAARGEGDAKLIDLARFAHGDSRLALPATLKQHLAWRSGLLWIIFGVVFGIIELCFACALLAVRDDPQATTPAVLLAMQGILVGMHIGILLLMDARLFASVGTSDLELSGTHQIVRFSRLQSADLVRPTIPFTDYTQQMDLLISLIHERTGLPLYDLREKK
jgi:uncharacterized membrane protein/uncharacterized membrane protein (DUF485 family)